MQYTLLIYESDADFALRNDPQRAPEYWNGWTVYTEALQKAGVMAGGAGLEPVHTATLLQLRDGKRVVQDGPYADAKEQLGGYYVLDVPDLDTALDWAARCPAAANGTLELRPHMADT